MKIITEKIDWNLRNDALINHMITPLGREYISKIRKATGYSIRQVRSRLADVEAFVRDRSFFDRMCELYINSKN